MGVFPLKDYLKRGKNIQTSTYVFQIGIMALLIQEGNFTFGKLETVTYFITTLQSFKVSLKIISIYSEDQIITMQQKREIERYCKNGIHSQKVCFILKSALLFSQSQILTVWWKHKTSPGKNQNSQLSVPAIQLQSHGLQPVQSKHFAFSPVQRHILNRKNEDCSHLPVSFNTYDSLLGSEVAAVDLHRLKWELNT